LEKKKKDWLEKSLDRKPTPIEVFWTGDTQKQLQVS